MWIESQDNLLLAWSWPPLPGVGIAVTEVVYLRGWMQARKTRPRELPIWRALCFSAGLVCLWIALASPIDALDDLLLTAHMLQHFLLMSVVPPLLLLGAPVVPLLRGLPRWLVRRVLGPLLKRRWVHAFLRFLLHPLTAWLSMNVAYLLWHVPAAFERTLRSVRVHDFEHLCFLFTSLLFWRVVLAPWPARLCWPRWTVIPYLLSADIVNTMLSAFLVFSGRVLYPTYAAADRLTGMSPLQDQAAAGAEMWVLNSIVFLFPAVVVIMQQLARSPRSR